MDRVDAPTRLLSGEQMFYTQKSPSLDLLTGSAFTAARDTSLCESVFGRMEVQRQLLVYKENIHRRAVCLVEEAGEGEGHCPGCRSRGGNHFLSS
jgi:hypothetical protein